MSWAAVGMAGFQVVSGFQQAETMRGNARLSREINDMQADALEVDAYKAETMGYTQAARYGAVADKAIADQKVAYTSKDVDVTSGTAAEVLAESRLNKILNTQDIINQAHEKAVGIKSQARNTRLQGSMNFTAAQQAAGAAQNEGLIRGGSTLLSGYEKGKFSFGKSSSPSVGVAAGKES